MILLIDTSGSVANIYIADGEKICSYHYKADRTLAKNIFSYISEVIRSNEYDWSSIKAIGVFKGPGSFTGLRIGITVANTLASANKIPIVGASGDDWQKEAIDRLRIGEDEGIIMPLYGAPANITSPKK